MITLVSSPKQHLPKHMQHSVHVFNKPLITLSVLNCYSPNFQEFILMKNALNNQVGMLGDMFLWLVANLKQGVIYFIKQACGNDILASVYDWSGKINWGQIPIAPLCSVGPAMEYGVNRRQQNVHYHNTTPQKFNNPIYNFFFSATTGSSKFTSLDTQPPSFSCYWPLQSSSIFGMSFFVLCSTYLNGQSIFIR